jgi:hypothetical protein
MRFCKFILPIPANAIFDPVNVMWDYVSQNASSFTVSGDIRFVRHEDDVEEIVQKVDDIVDAIFGSILWIRIVSRQIGNKERVQRDLS